LTVIVSPIDSMNVIIYRFPGPRNWSCDSFHIQNWLIENEINTPSTIPRPMAASMIVTTANTLKQQLLSIFWKRFFSSIFSFSSLAAGSFAGFVVSFDILLDESGIPSPFWTVPAKVAQYWLRPLGCLLFPPFHKSVRRKN
jgi:hypothetical protein